MGWGQSVLTGTQQKFPVDDFEWRKDKYGFGDKRYTLEINVKYPKKLHELHSDFSFLPKKCEKLMCNLCNKNETILKSQQRFSSEAHNVFTEKVNKSH